MNGRLCAYSLMSLLALFYASLSGRHEPTKVALLISLSSLITRGRGVLVALALGATAITAMPAPAVAQSFRFDFQINGGGSDYSWGYDRRGKRVKRDCLSTNEIRRGLRRLDFEDIRFIDKRGRRVTVVAEYDPNNRLYSMVVHTCSGKVTDIERVRRDRGRDRDRDYGDDLY